MKCDEFEEDLPFFILNSLDHAAIVEALATTGAISVPLLAESVRLQLQQEAERYRYRSETRVVGEGDRRVWQDYSSCETVPPASRFMELAAAFQALLDQTFAPCRPYPFSTPLKFNSWVLQRYQPGQLGITPHRDSLRAINLVCIFNLSGEGQFYLCQDRSGREAQAIDTTPGHVILMRAPSFLGSSLRPFHYVANFQSTRYSFGLRQRIDLPIG